MIPVELTECCDAIYWKELTGFDFSAYSIALRAIALHSSGADVFVMNDSVLGPLFDVDPLVAGMPWRLSGFIASSAFENHIQSYAWVARTVDEEFVLGLSSVMLQTLSFNRFRDVVSCQETRFARIASRLGSVGALWFGDNAVVGDPSLMLAVPLVDEGFPFIKKSLISGKFAHLGTGTALRERLYRHGHPEIG